MNKFQGQIELTLNEKQDLRQLRELKSQRDLFEDLLNVLSQGILVIDSKDQIIFINKCAKNILKIKNISSKNQIDLKECILNEIIENTRNLDFLTYHREIEVLDPHLRYLSISCIPYEKAENNTYRIYFINDITKKKSLFDEKVINPNFNDNLTFGAGIAHELGNPIAGLSLHAQLLNRLFAKKRKNKNDNEQIKKSIDVLNNELSRLDNTIHQFLDAIRPTNPQFSLQNIMTLINDVINTLSEKLKKHKIQMKINLENEYLDDFLLDENRIKQALANVIINAVEVSNENSTIEISILQNEDFCQISIKDYGKGISASDIDKIFDPFYTTKETGNGLGLLITYRIIKDHGGTISVKSKPGEGTVFSLSLPLRKKAVKQLSFNK
ncbi:MAG: sensor protein ZraS [uncultured bacterium]|nr:MAG: sensor protein ZraS [uncultured bacterium]